MRWTLVRWTLAAAALAATARAARPLDPPDLDPFEDALPPSVRVAVEYIAYYLSTACAPLTEY